MRAFPFRLDADGFRAACESVRDQLFGRVQARLNQALNSTLKSPAVRAKLADMGSADVSGTPEQLARFITKEIPYWQSIVKRSGATVD